MSARFGKKQVFRWCRNDYIYAADWRSAFQILAAAATGKAEPQMVDGLKDVQQRWLVAQLSECE